MWRQKIVVRSSTTEADVLRALPEGFDGHITFEEPDERDKRVGCQVYIIHHSKGLDTKQVYENLGIELHGCLLLPLFLFAKNRKIGVQVTHFL